MVHRCLPSISDIESDAGVKSGPHADGAQEMEYEGSEIDAGSPQPSGEESSGEEDEDDGNDAGYRNPVSPVAMKSLSKGRSALSIIAPSEPSTSQLRQTQDPSEVDTIILPDLLMPDFPSPPSSPKGKSGKPEMSAAEKQAVNRTKSGARGTTQQQMTLAKDNVELVEATWRFLKGARLGYVLLDIIWGRHRFHGDYLNNRPLVPNWVERLFQDFSFGSGIRSSMFPVSIGVMQGELPEGFKFATEIGDGCEILTLERNPQLNVFVCNGNHRREAGYKVYVDSEEGKKVLQAKIEQGSEQWDEDEEGVSFIEAQETYRLMKIKSKQARYMFAEVYDKGMCE